MKQVLIGLVLGVLFAACTVAQPTPTDIPTSAPIAQLPIATPTPLLPTETPTQLPSATSTQTFPTVTSTFTVTPTPSATQSPTVQFPITPSTPIASNPASLPEGYLQFFWDIKTPVERPSYFAIPVSEPQQDLYVAIPDKTPFNWQLVPILSSLPNWPDEYTSWPTNAVSPDQTQLAFTLYKDSDNNPRSVNIHLADFENGELAQITNDLNIEIYHISWQPDNTTLIYSLGKEVKAIEIDGMRNHVIHAFTHEIDKLTSSPNGELAAVILETGDFYFLNLKNENLHSFSIDEPLDSDNGVWSSNSDWFTTNLISNAGLIAFNAQTNESLKLVDLDYFAYPSWSPNSSLLAFVKMGVGELANLYIWDATNQIANPIISPGSYFGAPVWSPQGNYLAVASSVEDERVDLYSIDMNTNEINTIIQFDDVKRFRILSWSPDEQWVLVFLAQENQSCLYIVNRINGDIYCAVDSTGMITPFDVNWLPGKPSLP